ncbi:MAG: DUF374 domain-containing protein [Fibrobacteria bacterium]
MRSLILGLGCLWLRTWRVRWISGGCEGAQPRDGSIPARAVLLLWHEHLPACIRAFSGRGIEVLISRSPDGGWAADACARFGYRVHRGSSSRGSMGGLREIALGMQSGSGLAGMVLDGPRGPRRQPKEGSLWLARRAHVPVVPVRIEALWAIRLKSWDRCLIPLPFAKVTVYLGKPFHPESPAEIGAAMRALETGTNGPEAPESARVGASEPQATVPAR